MGYLKDKTEFIKFRVSSDDKNELASIANDVGVSKSDILRMGIRVVIDNIKKTHSDIKKKADIIKSKGCVPSLSELWSVNSDSIEKDLNNGSYKEILKKSKKSINK